jgi:hypothetical protein
MVVVFSEPMDPDRTSPGIVLRRDGTSVPGDVTVDATIATFTPRESLLASTAYVLEVDATVRDRDGESLDEPVGIEFTTGLSPEVTLSLAPSGITVGRGAQGAAQVRIDHPSGALHDLTPRAIGIPAGVAVHFDSVALPNSNVTAFAARFDAGPLSAVGTFPVQIQVTGAGGVEHSATLDLTVTSQTAVGNTSVQFCPQGIPLWFAFQDGEGPWTVVAGSGDVYRFDLVSSRGAVAWVFRGVYGGFFTTVMHGSRAELAGAAAVHCRELPTGTKTIHGTVGGVSSNELVGVTLGHLYSYPTWDGPRFTLRGVVDRPTDLIASRVVWDDGYRMTAGIIRRNLNPANESTMPVLDFSSTEAIPAVTRTLTIAKAPDDFLTLSVLYRTASGDIGFMSNEDPYWDPGSTASVRRYGVFPSTPAGDLQLLYLTVPGESRWLRTCVGDAVDQSVAFPPPFGPVAVSRLSGPPPARFRVRYDVQPEYPRGFAFHTHQEPPGGTNALSMIATEAYLQGSTLVDLTSPDFTGIGGWNPQWGTQPGSNVTWNAQPGGWFSSETIDCQGGVPATGGSTGGIITP